jgi:hypothetical protein
MSSKLKGSNAAVRFLLSHGEKLWMLGIVACAGLLLWSALGRERLEDGKTPTKLQDLIVKAKNHIQDFDWDEYPEKEELTASTVSSEAMKPIPHKHFPPLDAKFNTRVLDAVKLRTDPELLAVLSLEAYGDSGIFSTSSPESIREKELKQAADLSREERDRLRSSQQRAKEDALFEEPDRFDGNRGKGTTKGPGGVIIQPPPRSRGGSVGLGDTEAESWVAVVAKVPIKDQYARYQNVLASARGYSKKIDLPRYKGYFVFRTKVTVDGEGKWEKIAAVGKPTIEKEMANNVTQTALLINKKQKHPLLTYPLPTLILREWDNRITHSEIPLLTDEVNPSPLEEEPFEEKKVAEDGEDDPFGGPSTSRKDRLDSSKANRRDPRGQAGFGPGRGLGEASASPNGYGPASGSSAGSKASLSDYFWDNETEFLLFRYIDRDVQPGEQYRYKIQLALNDVNEGADEAYLDKTVTDRQKSKNSNTRLGPVSEPSPIVSVPMLARIYLANAKPAREDSVNSEPELELLVKAYEGKMAAEAARSDSVKRGSVVNIQDQAIVIWTKLVSEKMKTEFDFYTGMTLIDIAGGEGLNRKNRNFIAPSRAVLMDATGRLFIQSQVDDSETVIAYQDIVDSQKRNRTPAADDGRDPRRQQPGRSRK